MASLRRSIRRSISRNIKRSQVAVEAEGGGASRFITKFNVGAAQYITFPVVNPAGDFRIEIDFFSPTRDVSGSENLVTGNENFGDVMIINLTDTKVRFYPYIDGVYAGEVSVPNPKDGMIHRVNVFYDGTNISIDLDGGTPALKAYALNSNKSIGNIGRWQLNSQYLDTYFLGLKIFDNGVLEREYKVDESWADDLIAVDSVNGQDGTAFNITDADAELFTLNTSTTPHQYENSDESIILPIFGTG